MALDYSLLQRAATADEVSSFKKSQKKASDEPAIILASIAFGMFVFLTIASVLLGIVGAVDLAGTLGALNIFFCIALIVTIIIIVSSRSRAQKLAKMNNFAQANGLTLMYDRLNTMYAGIIFQHGRSRSITESYGFPDGKEMGNYTYTTGSGRSQQVHYWGYVRFKLPRKLPHMLLDAKKNNLLGRFSNLPVSLHADQTMSLEGNFNDFFTLYAPKGYEKDALYVFTPDVMATLIDHGAEFDIEVLDDNLYLYRAGLLKLDDEQTVRSLVEVVEKIGTEVKDQGDYYADERVNNRLIDEVAVPGRRLKRGVSVFSIVLFIVLGAYYFLEVIAPLIWSR